MQWIQDSLTALFSKFGWGAALLVVVVLVLLATFVAWFLRIDVAGWLSSVNWNGIPRGRLA